MANHKNFRQKLSKHLTDFLQKSPKYLIYLLVLVYEGLVVALLFYELRASSFRATDRVLILLGLPYLPVLFSLVSKYIKSRGLTIKFGDVEIELDNLQEKVVEEVEKQNIKLRKRFEGKLSTAEQTLYPIIGGRNSFARDRLRNQKKLLIGCKDFPANIVVVELVSQHLNFELQQYECIQKFANGGTVTNYAYLQNHWVDLIVDYTATGCLVLNIEPQEKTPQQILQELNDQSIPRFQAEWIQILGTNTDYCLVMSKDKAEKMKIKKISDLAYKRKELKFCGNYEFLNRLDGLANLKKHYNNIIFAEESICSYYERYAFLEENKADVTVGMTTEPAVENLQILEDDKHFFPNYWECPVVRLEALEMVEGLREALLKLANFQICNQDIRNLIYNYQENPDSISKKVNELLKQKRNQS
ncbi:ABC transporter substrate-binding protein [Crocosphaera sp.]|uniref:ABC transporter substrate-binding protein n=1 Tax=Crocosphaera sp. TaxID=2729996 RepID=UPI003F272EB2|nr:glycine betaine ABC transporter substrate-binding protein [Crocosphaera sp.]